MLIIFFSLVFLLFLNIEGFQADLNGEDLQICSTDPMTGYTRNGKCDLDERDEGTHTVCAEVTDEFLEFSRDQGNDLITPNPKYNFPGLNAGDKWCLCAIRWKEAYDCANCLNDQSCSENQECSDISYAGVPKIIEDASHIKTLELVPDLNDTDIRERYIQ